jgi:hypothetical protein
MLQFPKDHHIIVDNSAETTTKGTPTQPRDVWPRVNEADHESAKEVDSGWAAYDEW